jgi:hypothetical protein
MDAIDNNDKRINCSATIHFAQERYGILNRCTPDVIAQNVIAQYDFGHCYGIHHKYLTHENPFFTPSHIWSVD